MPDMVDLMNVLITLIKIGKNYQPQVNVMKNIIWEDKMLIICKILLGKLKIELMVV